MAVVIAAGGLALALGLLSLTELRRLYRQEDMAYSESPETFRLWFLDARRRDPDQQRLAARVGDKIRIMRLEMRGALVDALMSDRFVDSFGTDAGERRTAVATLADGILNALSASPMNGDLWLAAARLRRRQVGFDDIARQYLEASFRYAPQEFPVAVNRLFLAARVSPFLSDELKELALRDYALLRSLGDQKLVASAEQELRQRKLVQ
jgi:hypothetical protein